MNIKKILNNKIVKAGSWYTITNFFTKGLSFLTLPVFTRLLTTEDYGKISIYGTYVSIITIVFSLGLTGSVQRGKFDFKEKYNDYFSSVMFLGILSYSIFSILIILFIDFFSILIGFEKILIIILLVQSFFSFIQNITLAKFQVEYNYKKVSILNILNSLISIFLSIIFITTIFQENGYMGKIIGGIVPLIFFGIALIVYTFKNSKKIISLKYWKYALIISLPLILHNLSGIVNSQFDRILIDKFIGNSETGIYSFAYNIGMIITILWSSTNQTWVPWFFEKMETNDISKIKTRANNFRDFFTFAYIIILFVSPELIKLMADKAYWEGLYIVPFVFMAYYFNLMYSFEVNVEFYYKKTSMISIGTILTAILNIVLNIIFIPKYGYFAAAITTAISNFCLFLFHFIITNYILKHKLFGIKFHFISFVYVNLSTLLFIEFNENIFIRYFIVVLFLIIFCFKIKKK